MGKWIKVQDIFPEESKDVLVYGRLGFSSKLIICCYEDKIWYSSEHGKFITHVTHWQPLPKLPA